MTFNQLKLKSENLLVGLPTKDYYPVDYSIEFIENDSEVINQKKDQVNTKLHQGTVLTTRLLTLKKQ